MSENTIVTFEQKFHHYIQLPSESHILEQVLIKNYSQVAWSVAANTVIWPEDFKKPTNKKLNTLISKETLTEALLQAEKLIHKSCNETLGQLNNLMGIYQVAALPDKVQRAKAIIANTACAEDLSILQKECDLRQKKETPLQLAKKQLIKATAYSLKVVTIDGIKSISLQNVKKQTEVEGLNKIIHEFLYELENIPQ